MSDGTTVHAVRIPDALWTEMKNAAAAPKVSVSEIIRRRCTPTWETPAHEEVDLATTNPEDLGLDAFGDDPLVKAVNRAQAPSLEDVLKEVQEKAAPAAAALKS